MKIHTSIEMTRSVIWMMMTMVLMVMKTWLISSSITKSGAKKSEIAGVDSPDLWRRENKAVKARLVIFCTHRSFRNLKPVDQIVVLGFVSLFIGSKHVLWNFRQCYHIVLCPPSNDVLRFWRTTQVCHWGVWRHVHPLWEIKYEWKSTPKPFTCGENMIKDWNMCRAVVKQFWQRQRKAVKGHHATHFKYILV